MVRDYKTMQVVDPVCCTPENTVAMLDAIKKMVNLDDEYQKNLGFTLKITEKNPEGEKAGVCWTGEMMVNNDRKKTQGYMNRASATDVIASKKKKEKENDGADLTGNIPDIDGVLSDEDEKENVADFKAQKQSRISKAKRTNELISQNDQFLAIMKEKNESKELMRQKLAESLNVLTASKKQNMAISMIGKNKVHKQ